MGTGKNRDKAGFLSLQRSRPAFAHQEKISAHLQEYLTYYNLPLQTGNYWFGYIETGKYHCAAHLSIPAGKPKGTVLLIHGFLSHFGFYQDLIPLLLDDGWAVAGIDLPGHGLSTGKPTAIDDFSSYGAAVGALVQKIRDTAPRPFIAAGHSMGCASLLEYRLHEGNDIDQYIFIAPLVRSTMYGLTQFGFTLLKPLLKVLPRMYQKTSSNAAYLEFKEFHDPLQTDQIAPDWVRALFTWNSRIEETSLPPMDLTIIQGDQDRVVDFRYNLEFLTSRIPDTKTFMIPGGRHELPKEAPKYQKKLFAHIFTLLDQRDSLHE